MTLADVTAASLGVLIVAAALDDSADVEPICPPVSPEESEITVPAGGPLAPPETVERIRAMFERWDAEDRARARQSRSPWSI